MAEAGDVVILRHTDYFLLDSDVCQRHKSSMWYSRSVVIVRIVAVCSPCRLVGTVSVSKVPSGLKLCVRSDETYGEFQIILLRILLLLKLLENQSLNQSCQPSLHRRPRCGDGSVRIPWHARCILFSPVQSKMFLWVSVIFTKLILHKICNFQALNSSH